MSFQQLSNFAKFLKIEFKEGDFSEGQIERQGYKNKIKYISQIGSNGANDSSSIEESKCRDLAHEIAHYLIANKDSYKLKNFGLPDPGIYNDEDEYQIDVQSCILGCIIMNRFDINTDYIYRELINDEFDDQKSIDKEVEKLILSGNLKSDRVKTIIKKPNNNILKRKDNLPLFFTLPKFFNISHQILQRN